MPEPAGRPVSRAALLLVAIAIVAGVIFFELHRDAFPFASLNLALDGPGARAAAEEFLRSRRIPFEGYDVSVSFDDDERIREFLERTLGMRLANTLIRERINVWCWKVRFFRSFRKEELEVALDPGGRLVGFEHTLAEDDDGGDGGSGARDIAWAFLDRRLSAEVKSSLVPSDERQEILPRRTDRTYAWKRTLPDFPALDYLYEVVVSGKEVSSYREYLRVPEYFVRMREREAGRGELLSQSAGFLTFLFTILAVLMLMRWSSGAVMRMRVPLILGGVVLVLTLLHGANSWPLYFSRYDTSNTLGSHMGFAYLLVALEGVLSAFVILYAGTVGSRMEQITAAPPPLSLGQSFSLRGLFGARAARAVGAGCLGALVVLGWQTGFYLLARKWLGAYVPTEVPYSDILSTAMPWFYPLIIGITASLSEELLFRLLGVSFFRRLTGSGALGLLAPAALWAFMHCNYPQQPYWIRGVELTVVGVFWGWLYRRWGILASLTAHYMFNAVLGAMLLMTSPSPLLRFSGVLVVCLPGLIPLFRLLAGRRLPAGEPEADPPEPPGPSVTEGEPPLVTPPAEKARPLPALSSGRRLALCLLGAAGFIVAFCWPAPRLGEVAGVTAGRLQVTERAREVLRGKGVSLKELHFVAALRRGIDYYQARYLVRELGTRGAAAFLEGRVPVSLWYVRAFRSGKKEEHLVRLLQDGTYYGYDHAIPEDEPGAALTAPAALEKARALLRATMERPCDTGWTLVETNDHRRKNRVDYDFRFECPSVRKGEAVLRADVQVKGDAAVNCRPYFKLPESLLHVQRGRTFRDVFILASFLLLGLAVFLGSLRLLASSLRSAPGRLSLALRAAAIPAVLQVAGRLVTWPELLFDYDTTQALPAYVFSQALPLATSAVFTFFCAAWLLLTLDALFRDLYGRAPGPLDVDLALRDRETLVDTAYLGYGLCGLFLGAAQLSLHGREALARAVVTPNFASLPFADSYVPALAVVGVTLPGQLLMLLAGAVMALSLLHRFRGWPVRALTALLVMAAFADLTTKTLPELASTAISLALAALFITAVVKLFLGLRLRAYLALYLLIPPATMAPPLLTSGEPFLAANGIALALLALAPLLLLLPPRKRSAAPDG